MGSHVGEATAVEVGVLLVVLLGLLADVVVEVVLHSEFLVPGTREVVAETTGAAVPRDLGEGRLGAADGSDPRAGTGEGGSELRLLRAIVGLAGGTDAWISGSANSCLSE